jgi:hypothetical protein
MISPDRAEVLGRDSLPPRVQRLAMTAQLHARAVGELDPGGSAINAASLPALRAPPNFLNQINLMLPVQSPVAKINPFSATPNHPYIPTRLIPHEGRIAIVTDAGWDAVDAAAFGAQGIAGRIYP